MNKSFLNHHFLIAMPGLHGDGFEKAVIYVCEHDEQGAMGLVVNKPLQMRLGRVLSHLEIPSDNSQINEQPVLMGGPVGQEHGFILMRNAQQPVVSKNKRIKTSGSRAAVPRDKIMMSASKSTLMDLAQKEEANDFIVTLGYAAWNPGQLEEEIMTNNWLIIPFDERILFEIPLHRRWAAAAARIGVDVRNLSSFVGHA